MENKLKDLELELSKVDDQIKELQEKKDLICKTFANENLLLKEGDKVKVSTKNPLTLKDKVEYGILDRTIIRRFLGESTIEYKIKAIKKNGEIAKVKHVYVWHDSIVTKA